MNGCEIHPRYKAVRAPRASTAFPHGCPKCWEVWHAKQAKPKLFEPDGALLEHIKKMTAADIEKWKADMSESYLKRKEEERRKRNEPPRDDRTGTCVVCKGKVIARVTRQYLGDPRHMIIGPGSRSQMTMVHHGFHCTGCGLKYEFPSPERNTPE